MSTVPRARDTESMRKPDLSGRWALVKDASVARFHVRDKLVSTVHGTFPIEDGVVVVSGEGEITEAWVRLSVAGIATGNAHRDRDVRGPRFLDAEGCPAVVVAVETTRETPTGWEPDAVILARGARAPVDLTVMLVDEPRPRPDGPIRVRVAGRLDRRPLAMKVPTFVVGRFLDLEADLRFARVAPRDDGHVGSGDSR
ncbi:MAG: YceI family protein [Intrasporangium sp.]|uniref:YceI family protein n=1 Tax=Intrasporangium sp. TaxID=1925024 RepID=UPI0026485C38|nr:YceI family protein [Intrasporangium sp.]MDN5797651.1 YceI family protein [Intrasporangium sp.]